MENGIKMETCTAMLKLNSVYKSLFYKRLTGEFKVPIVGGAFLILVGQADRAGHVQNDLVQRLSPLNLKGACRRTAL